MLKKLNQDIFCFHFSNEFKENWTTNANYRVDTYTKLTPNLCSRGQNRSSFVGSKPMDRSDDGLNYTKSFYRNGL